MNETDPLAVILVKNGSRGDKLLFLYPFAKETGKEAPPEGRRLNHYALPVKEDMQVAKTSSTNIEDGRLVGFSHKTLSNLFAVKPQLCGNKFELKVNDVRFVSNPMHLQSGVLRPNKGQQSSIILFNIVFALRATASHSVVRCYHDLSRRLGAALRYEERRCSYLSDEAKIMLTAQDEHHEDEDVSSSAFETILDECLLAKELQVVYECMCKTGIMRFFMNGLIEISFCLPQRAHSLINPNLIVEPEALDKCFKELRPYHAVLLLVSVKAILSTLPPESSQTLRRLVKMVNPMKSLQQLASDTDFPIGHVFELVSHLVYWAKATVIFPLCETNVYILSPYAPTHISSTLVERFTAKFPRFSMLHQMSDFSFPKPLSPEPLNHTGRQSHRVRMVIWMLQHRLLMQLHTYVYLVPSPPSRSLDKRFQSTLKFDDSGSVLGMAHSDSEDVLASSEEYSPSPGYAKSSSSGMSDDTYSSKVFEDCLPRDLDPAERDSILKVPAARNPNDLRLFARLCPYFRGRTHLEDIMYHENVHRPQILSLLDKFSSVLITCQHEDTAVTMYYRCTPS